MTLTATVGREAELDSIQAFVDAVPRGPSALTISGEAGIGKTILWEAGVEAARDRRVPRIDVPWHRGRGVAVVRGALRPRDSCL